MPLLNIAHVSLTGWRRRGVDGLWGAWPNLKLFRSALLAAEPPFAVLHIYGPGGVGKTTLLREYARLAAECGGPVVHLDGRNVDLIAAGVSPGPASRTWGRRRTGLSTNVRSGRRPASWLIDTYEILAPLDAWLRETFLPQLPGRSLSYRRPQPAASPGAPTSTGWSDTDRAAAQSASRREPDLPGDARHPRRQHADALAFTHGHPLALALVADVLSRDDKLAGFNPRSEPDVVRVLLERLVQDVPSLPNIVWRWRSASCRGRRPRPCWPTCWTRRRRMASLQWLRQLSFIEHGRMGSFRTTWLAKCWTRTYAGVTPIATGNSMSVCRTCCLDCSDERG